jgi:hypothetical protein
LRKDKLTVKIQPIEILQGILLSAKGEE